MMKRRMTSRTLCLIALCVVVNIVGGQLALLLRLPIYLDSIGTVLCAALFGAWYGMLPSLLSGLIMTMLNDPYALYYAPVGMLYGFLCGWLWKKPKGTWRWLLVRALAATLPTSFVSACITATLFGGITSSGSSALVQLLAQTPLGLTLSCFVVQVLTDYADRALSFGIVGALLRRLPHRSG